MIRIDRSPIPEDKGEVRLFMVGIDAEELIPHLFSHYFDVIGVDRIFYIDNNSTDNSLGMLSRYDRVHIWSQGDKFSGNGTPARSGAAWMQDLMDVYGIGQWCLLADTDELFVYPDYKETTIGEFTKSLDGDCVLAKFVDMYSDRKVRDTKLQGSFLETCPFTDKIGSCRARLLGFTPVGIKMPLFVYTPNISVGAGFHSVSGYQRLSSVTCSVLHFKFLSVLPERLEKHGHKMTDGSTKAVVYRNIGDVNFYDPNFSVRL